MVDIHSHILWGLDDGAKTLEESVSMLRLAADAGTTDIVATPHANYEYAYEPELVRERIAALSCSVAGKPVIHQGCDFHLSFDNIQSALLDPAPFLIDNGPYLLVEFPDASLSGMSQVLRKLLDRGLVPIMTHPERNLHLHRIPSEFLKWIEQGCLVQVTAQSLFGRFGKTAEESAWAMLRRGIAHFVASDAHDTKDRTPRLDAAFEAVSEECGSDRAKRLFLDNPRAVLAGRVIQVEIPARKPWRPWS